MLYFVYILFSLKNHSTYTGYTNHVPSRLCGHNEGNTKATTEHRPWMVMYVEKCATKQEAKHRELYWKGGGGRRRLKIIYRDFHEHYIKSGGSRCLGCSECKKMTNDL